MRSKYFYSFTLLLSTLFFSACEKPKPLSLTTIADARNHPAHFIDIGELGGVIGGVFGDVNGDSIGDVLVFEQPLLDSEMNTIGTNSGSCIRTRVGIVFQCQWLLTFIDNNKVSGTILVVGQEYDEGTSTINIVGGTGKYSGIMGEMESTNNNNGTFTQILNYSFR